MLSEVGIGPKSLCYGFLNEIVAHPWSEGGLGIIRLGCTKFNEGCTKFCEGCTKFCEKYTKGLKMRSEVGIDPQSLSYGFLNKIMTHSWLDGGPGITRFGCTKFKEGCTKGPNVRYEVGINTQSLLYGLWDHFVMGYGITSLWVTRWGSTPNHFVMGLDPWYIFHKIWYILH